LLELASGITGLVCFLGDRIDDELFAVARHLKVVSQVAVGVDNIDLKAATKKGVPVGHTPDVLTDTTADTALALLLAVLRRLPEGWSLVREGRWEKWSLDLLIGHDLHHSTVGIVGLGRIGAAVAKRLQGFATNLVYTGPKPKPAIAAPLAATYLSLDGLLREADHVILTAPLNDSTHHLIGAAELALMKRNSTLVNVARGGLVDTDALVSALRDGPLGRAGLDVTDPEPLPASHPLVELDNCLVIPHLGSASERTRQAMASLAVDNLLAGLAGRRLPACANPEVYEGV
jgi:lactate dehydrogenase-like 2-hydroxyacid dehydrogenase